MIVQTAPEGAPRFVIQMAQHTALASALAHAFGNAEFEPVRDEETHFIVAHHDDGWADLDAQFRIDPATGFPYNLAETPFDLAIGTSVGSPDRNEAHDPFCGLLSSMHSWGLYTGRYGLSNIRIMEKLVDEDQDRAKAMLDDELARQDRLKAELRENPDRAERVEEPRLMQSYKQLQFFDTLALYFNRVHEDDRSEEVFIHVPKSETEDVDITVTPIGNSTYRVSPYPFGKDPLTLDFEGRYVDRAPDGTERLSDGAAIPVESQRIALTAG